MRLKKNPDVPDYVVEADGLVVLQVYDRARARRHAKALMATSKRVRVFRARFTLVSDTKKNRRK